MFWQQAYPETFGASFEPVNELGVLQLAGSVQPRGVLCGNETYDMPNAIWCSSLFSDEELIAWDRGFLVPTGRQYFGDTSIAALIAHEHGHAVQHSASIVNRFTETIVNKQQALDRQRSLPTRFIQCIIKTTNESITHPCRQSHHIRRGFAATCRHQAIRGAPRLTARGPKSPNQQ